MPDGKKREKRKAKRAAKRRLKEVAVPEPAEPAELQGVVLGGELLLRAADGTVYASERDDRGALVAVGRWEAGAVVPLPKAVSSSEAAGGATGEARQPSVPHPVPQPLAFSAAEDDHCETAPEAYAHIVSLLRLVARKRGVPPEELRIWDPYYCNGAVARHLAALGFPHVHNANEDFYARLDSGDLPEHDVLLTNPPYTHPHPERLLAHCAASGTPWLALMPNWVYTKDYYWAALGRSHGTADTQPFYIAPRKRYNYWTPRGRRSDLTSGGAKAKTHGHTNAALGIRTSPFVSFWYCGGFGPALRKRVTPPEGCELCWSTEELPPGVLSESDPRRKVWGGGGADTRNVIGGRSLGRSNGGGKRQKSGGADQH